MYVNNKALNIGAEKKPTCERSRHRKNILDKLYHERKKIQ
ncbi:hypothetical protein ADO05_02038 [Streptococcus parauberis]|nr:hypothetical protein ADO05_02038 [Streptococcus parauberis]POS66621.1 hypothetical protein AOS90_01871 [Streptococcus parauberis]